MTRTDESRDWNHQIARDAIVSEMRKLANRNADRCQLAEIQLRRLVHVLDDLLDLHGEPRREEYLDEHAYALAVKLTNAAERAVRDNWQDEDPYKAWGRS